MPRPIRATVHLAALRHNYLEAKRRCPKAFAWAVVKANAYGHGLANAVQALGSVADGFAVIEVDAAVRLRDLGVRQPIVLLEGFFSPDDLDVLAAHRISTAVHGHEQLRMLAARPDVQVPLLVKFNTGMNRLGFDPAERDEVLGRVARLNSGGERSVSLMTHFADADGSSGVDWQWQRFQQLAAGWVGGITVANSATILRFPALAASAIRPGIMMYGGSPFAEESAASLSLLPAMTLSSEIIALQHLAPGATVGYGRRFMADRPMRIGVVACGYADGYPRHAPTGTPVLVNGKRTRTVGRVSMDMLAVDLSDLPEAGVGSSVVLWGQGLAADEVAMAAETISYELFCALAPRVPVVVE